MSQSYQVIARRYRPKQFDELVGQDHIVQTLKNAILQEKIAHAYLFVGPRGTGKTSIARIFAKALNCPNGPSVTPDDNDPLCQSIINGTCMDVIEIDGASNNSVDQMRSLREDCQYAPSQGKFKIYIIDEVHMLSASAFNALLKTLEEPPAHVKFLFATTEANKVLPTITSRCQRFEFRPIPNDIIVKQLEKICKAENIEITQAALDSIARLAQGGMRDSQSILDQLISFCGNKIDENSANNVYGLTSNEDLESLAKAMSYGLYDDVVAISDKLCENGKDLYRCLCDLQEYIRKGLMHSIKNGAKTDFLGNTLTTENILRMLEVLHRGEKLVQTGLSEKVNFEITLLKAVEESKTRAIDTLIKQVEDLAKKKN